MKKSNSQQLPDRVICFLYKELLLPWENNISKKAFPNLDVFEKDFLKELTLEPMKNLEQMEISQSEWKQRKDQYLVVEKSSSKKSKAIICQLRNAFAHGDLAMCTRKRLRMIRICHVYDKRLRLFGQLTENNLQKLIKTITFQTR